MNMTFTEWFNVVRNLIAFLFIVIMFGAGINMIIKDICSAHATVQVEEQ